MQEPTEDEIAEKIFSWWISGMSYNEWYAEEYLQLKLPFTYDEEDGENGINGNNGEKEDNN